MAFVKLKFKPEYPLHYKDVDIEFITSEEAKAFIRGFNLGVGLGKGGIDGEAKVVDGDD